MSNEINRINSIVSNTSSHQNVMINLNNKKEADTTKTNKIIIFNKKFSYDDEDDYVDEAVKEDYDADEDENYELNEVVIENPKNFSKKLSSKCKKKDDLNMTSTINKQTSSSSATTSSSNLENLQQSSHSDSASSSESGFGTVDDEVETNKNQRNEIKIENNNSNETSIHIRQASNKHQNLQQQKSNDSTSSTQPLASNMKSSQPLQSLSFPILQPPRQIVYELNMKNADDVVNILNDNSSINSSTSSSGSNKFGHCCSKIIEKILRFYYRCFCCYSSSSHHNHSPILCSWLTIFCCCCPFLSGISLYLTHRSKKYKQKQKFDLADKYSSYAEKLNIAALIFGVIFYAIGFFMITLVIFMYWRPNNS